MHRLISGLLFLMLIPQQGFARDSGDSWENLKQLRPGQNIQVVDMKMKSHNATFVGVTEEAILLRTKDGETRMERANVLRVTLREHSKRLRNTLIGMAIGAVPGIALGEAGAAYAHNEGGNSAAYRAIPIAITTGIGAGIGAACPSNQTIYRTKKR